MLLLNLPWTGPPTAPFLRPNHLWAVVPLLRPGHLGPSGVLVDQPPLRCVHMRPAGVIFQRENLRLVALVLRRDQPSPPVRPPQAGRITAS